MTQNAGNPYLLKYWQVLLTVSPAPTWFNTNLTVFRVVIAIPDYLILSSVKEVIQLDPWLAMIDCICRLGRGSGTVKCRSSIRISK